MARLRFGAFLAPHHPLGEDPYLLFRRDVEFARMIDQLGFDELWVGEHHSGGWETIGSPEMFLVAAGENTKRIMLGTGVVSLPYHHPFNVAQRMVQLDLLTGGRAMLGVGPGALPSDAVMLGIDPAVQRDRMDEALGVIIQLLRADAPITVKSDWFTLENAFLQLKPLQENLPIAVASTLSPAGMKCAGKYGVGVISVASNSEEGLAALPTQWGFGETYAAENGNAMDRSQWRINMPWHIAPTREQAIAEVAEGVTRWHNEYNVGILKRKDAKPQSDAMAFATGMAKSGGAIFGTPDDAVAAIERLQKVSGGFGVLLGFAHDWASPEATKRSYELFAKYVIPRVQGRLKSLETSADILRADSGELMERAGQAVLAAIRQHNATHPRQQREEPKSVDHLPTPTS